MAISEKTKGLAVQVRSQKTAIISANEAHIAEAQANITKWEAENVALLADVNALTADIPEPKRVTMEGI